MELTIQEVHTYNNLVKEGKITPFKIPGAGDDSILLPNLDDDGKVYLHDITEGIKIYPGVNTIEKMRNAIDKFIN